MLPSSTSLTLMDRMLKPSYGNQNISLGATSAVTTTLWCEKEIPRVKSSSLCNFERQVLGNPQVAMGFKRLKEQRMSYIYWFKLWQQASNCNKLRNHKDVPTWQSLFCSSSKSKMFDQQTVLLFTDQFDFVSAGMAIISFFCTSNKSFTAFCYFSFPGSRWKTEQ